MRHLLLHQLQPFEPEQQIKVRLARMWNSIIPAPERKFVSVELLLVDEKGDAMQASIQKKDLHLFNQKLKEGTVYDIRDFFVGNIKKSFNAIAAEYMINFSRQTKMVEIANPPSTFPHHYFDFQPFTSLHARTDNNFVLTDVIGVLTAIGRVLKGVTRHRDEVVDKQNVRIQDLNGASMNITLWAENAHVLKQENFVQTRSNVVIALAGMTVRRFQGMTNLFSCSATKIYVDLSILDTKLLKRRYQPRPLIVQPLDDPAEPRRIGSNDPNENRMTIRQLMRINFESSKDTLFTCKVKIVEIDVNDGWFYNSCNQCPKGLRLIDGKFRCQNHGEQVPSLTCKIAMLVRDETGEADFVAFGKIAEELIGKNIAQMASNEHLEKFVLPSPLKALLNQERIFKVNLTKYAFESGVPTFAVNRTFLVEEKETTQILAAASSSTGPDHIPRQPNQLIPQYHGDKPSSNVHMPASSDLFLHEPPANKKGIRIQEPDATPPHDVIPPTDLPLRSLMHKKMPFSHQKEIILPGPTAPTAEDRDCNEPLLKKPKTRIQEPDATPPHDVIPPTDLPLRSLMRKKMPLRDKEDKQG